MQACFMEKIQMALSKALNGKSLTNLTPQTKLREDVGLDSITSLTFLMALEEFVEGFLVDPDTLDMSDLECIQTINQYIERQLTKAKSDVK
jgi:acyl carrier protein